VVSTQSTTRYGEDVFFFFFFFAKKKTTPTGWVNNGRGMETKTDGTGGEGRLELRGNAWWRWEGQ
jgi:hypothetical protein